MFKVWLVNGRVVRKWNTEHRKKDGTLIGKSIKGKWILRWGDLFFPVKNNNWGWFVEGDENNDEKYEGEIRNGKPNGNGTSAFPNGTKYVGKFLNGKKHGQGTLTLPDRQEVCREIQAGKTAWSRCTHLC